MDHERLRNVSAAIQSLAVAAAVVVGGIWTLLTFDLLEQRRKAQADLQEITARLEGHAAFELSLETTPLRQGPYYLLSVSALLSNRGTKSVELDFRGGSPLLVFPIEIGPEGKVSVGDPLPPTEAGLPMADSKVEMHIGQVVAAARQSTVPLVKDALRRLERGEIDNLEFLAMAQRDSAIANHTSMRVLIERSKVYIVRPGTTERIDYLVLLPGSGLYKLEFAALAPTVEVARAPGAVARWSTQRFIQVGPEVGGQPIGARSGSGLSEGK